MLRGKSTQFFDEQNVRPFGPVMMSVVSAQQRQRTEETCALIPGVAQRTEDTLKPPGFTGLLVITLRSRTDRPASKLR